jgi:AraC-like DNA-binding protein
MICMNDVLSDVFDTIKLQGTVYFRADFAPPWAVTVPVYEQAARFHLVIQGRCHARLPSGRHADLGPGDLILIPRGSEHVLSEPPTHKPAPLEHFIEATGYAGEGVFAIGSNMSHTTTQMVCGHFDFIKGADHPLLRALPEAIVMTSVDRARHPLLDETLRLVARRAFTEGSGSTATIRRLSEVFFIEAIQACVDQSPELASLIIAISDKYVGRALDLVHRAPAEPWSVRSIASEVGMSRSRFAERFTKMVGMAPIAYLGEWRLQKSLEKLLLTQDSIKEIARDVGYQSPAAYTRAFTSKFGAPPTQYRANASQV